VRTLVAVVLAVLALAAPARATEFVGGALTIPDSGQASPYPGTIQVANLHRLAGKVTVNLSLVHDSPADLDVILVGPRGQSVTLLDHAGTQPLDGGLTFDDAATAGVPDAIVTGTYRPAAPLAAFNGSDPNGPWKLYVTDDEPGDAGQIRSWRLFITDGPGAPIAWGAPAFSAPESAGAATLTVTRPTGVFDGTIQYLAEGLVNGRAVAGVDYLPVRDTLSFAPGQTSATIRVPILDNATDGPDRAFKVHLFTPGADVARPDQPDATVTITDDDPTPTLSVADTSIPEQGRGAFVVTLSAPSQFQVAATLAAVSGTAKPTVDYHLGPNSFTLPAGTTSVSVPITGVDDRRDEPNETVVAAFNHVVNATVARPTTTATIVDDDAPQRPRISAVHRHGAVITLTVTTNFDGTVIARAGGAKSHRAAIRAGHPTRLTLRSRQRRVTVTATGPSGPISARVRA
jgi:subtilisin-like proprotein convertase family protein